MTPGGSASAAKPSLLSRLQAWWEGDEAPAPILVPAPEPAAGGAAPAAEAAEADEKGPSDFTGWTPRRLAAAQRVFGPGCVLPGGTAASLELLRPLELKPDMRLLDFGARAGGLVRLAAQEFGCRATGFEDDPVLVAAADELARQAKLGAAANVVRATLRENALGSRGLDALVSREALHQLPDKDDVYACCFDLLKPGGQLLFTDFVSRHDGVNPAVEVWAAHERMHAYLETPERCRDLLERHRFEIVAFDDASQDYCRRVAAAMPAFAAELARADLDRRDREWLKFEVELYARRIEFLRSGDIGLSRVHARRLD